MKRFLLLFLLIPLVNFAQFGGGQGILKPVKWHTSVEKTGEDTYNLIFEADIDDGWHVYSQFNDPMASLPIEFEWKNAKGNYEVIGKAKEFNTHKAYNKVFKATETFFSKHAKLSQPIKLINKDLKKIDVTLFGQTCKESCIQIEEKLSFDLTKAKTIATKKEATPKKNDTPVAPVKTDSNKSDNSKADASSKTNTDTQEKNTSETNNKSNATNKTTNDLTEGGKYTPIQEPKKNTSTEQIKEDSKTNKKPQKTDWSVFWWAFFAGLVVLFTPCIYPMIPLTISFFTKQNENGSKGKINALIYALSIVLIYVSISIPAHIFEGYDSSFLNEFATNTGVNLVFFVIFLLFALNLFGVEKLDPARLFPSSWVNSADAKSNKGGILAGFFMALTLVIVSFSCTGPALGFVLGAYKESASGAMMLTYAMLGFGLGIAIPFGILAFFPVLLKKLPQSGAWLNSVKVVFAFLELAFAFKFLSNADLVNQWHILPREIFFAIWVAIAITLAMYLFGKLRFSHDAPVESIGVFRFLTGLTSLVFAIYMLPGLWGAPVKLISGLPPSMKNAESQFGVGYTLGKNANQLPEGAEYGPNNIVTFEDYDLALAYAKKVNKPLMIDFTGRQCQNCRQMEEKVWSQNNILPILNNEVVLVSLFVDEKTKLPEDEQYISKYTGDKVTTVGKKWSEKETFEYKNNSQPLYIIIDHDEKRLNEPVGYTPEVNEYYKWLRKGVDNFKKK